MYEIKQLHLLFESKMEITLYNLLYYPPLPVSMGELIMASNSS